MMIPVCTYFIQPLVFLEAFHIQLSKSRIMMYKLSKLAQTKDSVPRLIIYLKKKKKKEKRKRS